MYETDRLQDVARTLTVERFSPPPVRAEHVHQVQLPDEVVEQAAADARLARATVEIYGSADDLHVVTDRAS